MEQKDFDKNDRFNALFPPTIPAPRRSPQEDGGGEQRTRRRLNRWLPDKFIQLAVQEVSPGVTISPGLVTVWRRAAAAFAGILTDQATLLAHEDDEHRVNGLHVIRAATHLGWGHYESLMYYTLKNLAVDEVVDVEEFDLARLEDLV